MKPSRKQLGKNNSQKLRFNVALPQSVRYSFCMSNNNTEAKAQIKAILQSKFLKLVSEGMNPETAFSDVMGAFENQFPGLIEKLG